MKKRSYGSLDGWKGGPFYAIYVTLIIIIFYAPIFAIMVFSFNGGTTTTFGSFTWKWYQKVFENRALMSALWTTTSIAILATVFSTLIGTLGAIGLAELKKKRKNFVDFVLSVNNLPVVNPDIVTAVSLWVLFLATFGTQMGYMTMLLAHIAFCTPYVIIQVYPKVLGLDPSEMEAAMDLGATKNQAVRKVVIPDLMPSIASGAMMAFTMSFDDFVISYFVGGSVNNISTLIYSAKNLDKYLQTYDALSSIIFLGLGIILVVFEVIKGKLDHSEDDQKIAKKPLKA
jgi:spermidine/putrescine transport system permease protein